jgi:hypothetical protein
MVTSHKREVEVSPIDEGPNVNLPEIELGKPSLALYKIKE